MTYTEHATQLLVYVKDFEELYLQPYVNKQTLLLEIGEVDAKINHHVEFLTGFCNSIRAVVEEKTIDAVLVQELKQGLEKSGILKPDQTLKVSFKQQIDEVLPVIEEIIRTRDENS
jgi:phosphoenolpyruvate carboxylase